MQLRPTRQLIQAALVDVRDIASGTPASAERDALKQVAEWLHDSDAWLAQLEAGRLPTQDEAYRKSGH